MKDFIPVAKPNLNGNELKYVTECIKTGWVSSAGDFVKRFEEEFAKSCDVKYAITCTNGTAALHLALMALDIEEGDEVIVPDITFASSANVVIYTGATPVFVDVDKETWCIDIEKLKKAITDKTKVIMPVHLYGHPCDMKAIMKIVDERKAKGHKIFVIEDCAEAQGGECNGKKIGSFGDIGCFSFYGNKINTTGEGGMCVTNNEKLAEKMNLLKNHGMTKEKRYWHDSLGYNYRMTNIQAAIGLAQLERLEEFVKKRLKIAEMYNEQLKDVKGITLPTCKEWAKNVYWMYSVMVEDDFGVSRDELIVKLKEKGVDSRRFFYALSEMPMYKAGVKGKYPVSSELSRKGISLPTFFDLSEEEIKKVADTIKEIGSN